MVVALPKTKQELRSAVRRRQRGLRSRTRVLTDTARHRLGMTPDGLVEKFSRRSAHGWVKAAVDARPIRVTVHIDDLEVVVGWATSSRAEPSPDGEHRFFTLRLEGIWKYCGPTNRLTVRADGALLPISGHGMFLVPAQPGRRSLKRLRKLMSEGHVLGQKGKLQLSRKLDTHWQSGVLGLYSELREIFEEAYGYDLFIAYGSLLGAVREDGVIGHDRDFDSAFISKHTDGADAAAELRDIALLLIDYGFLQRGYTIGHQRAHLNVQSVDEPDIRVDIFHNYFDSSGHLRFPFGSAGSSVLEASQWQGTKEIDFLGHRVLVPTNAEQFVEVVYGSDWRIPQPGFLWTRDRTDCAEEAHLPLEYHQTIYWASFYARTGFAKCSSFFEKVDGFQECPHGSSTSGVGMAATRTRSGTPADRSSASTGQPSAWSTPAARRPRWVSQIECCSRSATSPRMHARPSRT